MSDQMTAEQTTTTAAPKKRAPRKSTVPHSAAIAAYAKAKNIDEVRAGKQFRAVLRANADTYKKNGGKAHVKNAPWSDHPRKALAVLFPTVPTFKG
jgi:hypothetical protein